MLRVKDIHVYYGAIHALKGLSFNVEQGELVTLLGANGAGKTTTLKTLSGLLRPVSGSVELDGNAVYKVEAHDIVRRGVAHVPEGRKVFPRFTVLENLKVGAYARRTGAVDPELNFVFEMFPRLKERQKQYAGTLSGGEQQMLAIGRALMASPRLLLIDEASLGLSPAITQSVFSIIDQINAQGVTVVLVEQGTAALSHADRAMILERGQIVHRGTGAETDHASLRERYLGAPA